MINFVKMSGAGNDFIVFDNRDGNLPEDREVFVRRICQRRLGVGADGVLFVEDSPSFDFKMLYYNADGGEAEMCGNGARCVSRYAYLGGIAPQKMTFETAAGQYGAEVKGENVKLAMVDPFDIELNFKLELGIGRVNASFANTGVPHAVIFLENVESADVFNLGKEVRYHERFQPKGTNANFAQILSPDRIRVRTYERGVEDETLACGTGAVAAAVVAGLLKDVAPPVDVITQSGGTLKVDYNVENDKVKNIFLEGDAVVVFEGKLTNEILQGIEVPSYPS